MWYCVGMGQVIITLLILKRSSHTRVPVEMYWRFEVSIWHADTVWTYGWQSLCTPGLCARQWGGSHTSDLPQSAWSIPVKMIAYRISPNKHSQSYAKHRQLAFIFYQMLNAKSLSNFVFLCF